MVHRHRHHLLALASFAVGAVFTWMLSATGTDGLYFRSGLYPWSCAALLIGGLVLGVTVSVKSAVAALVPFAVPQPLLAMWRGWHSPVTPPEPGRTIGELWGVAFAVSTVLLVFAVGCVAIGICVRLMFRR
ncbi:hypothetical protein [Sphaerisporangium sp. TRM90804]|uniref:hypothetical protein n=1 Tax=Sphaerisporangium sp. TRM90804 TaxID=3031113 RepID=UPI00244896F6|nr:hypothetical protein [Sphaerisporangium sp. TRM90804]MDH2423832.1 hypothetical protein [Sphaerisporangium sp. TRM90804]